MIEFWNIVLEILSMCSYMSANPIDTLVTAGNLERAFICKRSIW